MEILLLVVLVLVNGLFAMSEIAIVSARRARLQRLADEEHPGAADALALHEAPTRFLSTIQVGITTIGILAGAIGEDALVTPLSQHFAGIPLLAPWHEGLARALVVVCLTYFSVVIGELVPKRLGLLAPERTASIVAAPMNLLSRMASPLVTLLAISAETVLRPFRRRGKDEPPVTDEEIKVLMEQGAEAGVFHHAERQLVANVLHLDDISVRAVMTPRGDIDALDVDDGEDAMRTAIANGRHSRFVVYRADFAQIIGILHAGDLLQRLLAGGETRIVDCVRPAHYVPETLMLSQLLENMRRARTTVALVVDEYGVLQGLVTLRDIIDAIVGNLTVSEGGEESGIVRRDDGSWLVDGAVSTAQLKQVLDLTTLPGEDEGDFHTAAGFVLHMLGHIPKAAESFITEGYRFEVVDMDGFRIDKLMVSVVPPA